MKKINNLILSIILLVSSLNVHSQTPTLGLRFIDPGVTEGYTLFTPEVNNFVYLINNCGEKINEWEFSELPGATCYLLENGTLLRAGKDSLEIRDWNNNLIWSYPTTANGIKQHHDIEPLPNGNILCVVSDKYTIDEITEHGRNPALTSSNFRLDKVVEIEPVGTNDANIVWEWKFIDHVIQDFDNTKLHYGTVEDHPELLDLNFDNGITDDWTHVNAIDYNAELDQIMISPRHLSEILIIDHSTTIGEAAGHSGGNSNKGGDFLWRWGNPQVYRQGDDNDQKLFLQHDVKWVNSGYLDEGKITVFNNGGDGTTLASSIHLITPEIIDGNYTLNNGKFNPIAFEWSWSGSILGNIVYESKKSGTHSLPNGNLIIAQTSLGQVSEINKDGEILWSYRNPSGLTIHNQFENPSDNTFFRAEKYPINYIGFDGQDLTPKGIIENENLLSQECINPSNIENEENVGIKIVNPTSENIVFNKTISVNKIRISNILGNTIYEQNNFSGNRLNINLKPATYILQIFNENNIIAFKIIFY